MHALSSDGSLSMCCASDPPSLLYLKKQMDEGITSIHIYLYMYVSQLRLHVCVC